MSTCLIVLIQPAAGEHGAAQRGALAALRDSQCGLILFEG